jgi:hypothetical protein
MTKPAMTAQKRKRFFQRVEKTENTHVPPPRYSVGSEALFSFPIQHGSNPKSQDLLGFGDSMMFEDQLVNNWKINNRERNDEASHDRPEEEAVFPASGRSWLASSLRSRLFIFQLLTNWSSNIMLSPGNGETSWLTTGR